MQGGLWNQYTDPIEDKIYTRNKDKIRGQNNDTKCIITHLVCAIGLHEA